MTSEKTIKGIMVTLHIAEQQALFVMLAVDGTINRMGTGSVSNTERDLFIGRTTPDLFEGLRQRVGAELLRWIGQYGDPSPRGKLCRLTVGFQHADGSEAMSHWQYGAESQGPPPVVGDFVIAAVRTTEAWFQQQKQMAKK